MLDLKDFDTIQINGFTFAVADIHCTPGSADSGEGGGDDCYLTLALLEDLQEARKTNRHALPSRVVNLYFPVYPTTEQEIIDHFNLTLTKKALGIMTEEDWIWGDVKTQDSYMKQLINKLIK